MRKDDIDDIFDAFMSGIGDVFSTNTKKSVPSTDEIITIHIDKWDDRFKAAMRLLNTGELKIRRRKK